ncbi:hypothetical protein D4764_10G0005140 [Takifugu flavidus]|uniref:Uncharacterized protein n=1 Tax=Takifugu flavidus TaxID=433684 RepID=A0A5C6PI65_9TELE|nr:hypothetical protein D4764_10G0005140 [Takifugu flavidus]
MEGNDRNGKHGCKPSFRWNFGKNSLTGFQLPCPSGVTRDNPHAPSGSCAVEEAAQVLLSQGETCKYQGNVCLRCQPARSVWQAEVILQGTLYLSPDVGSGGSSRAGLGPECQRSGRRVPRCATDNKIPGSRQATEEQLLGGSLCPPRPTSFSGAAQELLHHGSILSSVLAKFPYGAK